MSVPFPVSGFLTGVRIGQVHSMRMASLPFDVGSRHVSTCLSGPLDAHDIHPLLLYLFCLLRKAPVFQISFSLVYVVDSLVANA
jgi:hypothetical protein